MRIRYHVSEGDNHAFHKYFVYQSPSGKQLMQKMQVCGAGFVTVLTLIINLLDEKPLWKDLANTAFCLGLFLVAMRFIFPFVYQLLTQKMRRSGTVGDHELIIAEEGLIERSRHREVKTAWTGIEDIITTKDHTFILLGATQALILPHKHIKEGSLIDFILCLRKKHHTQPAIILNSDSKPHTTKADKVGHGSAL